MHHQRSGSTWLFLCLLACLFVLSTVSPRLWDRSSHSQDTIQSQLANVSRTTSSQSRTSIDVAQVPETTHIAQPSDTLQAKKAQVDEIAYQDPVAETVPPAHETIQNAEEVAGIEPGRLEENVAAPEEMAVEIVATGAHVAIAEPSSDVNVAADEPAMETKSDATEAKSAATEAKSAGTEVKSDGTEAKMVEPAAAIASMPVEPQALPVAASVSEPISDKSPSVAESGKPAASESLEQPEEAVAPPPERPSRLPIVVANMPSPLKKSPQTDLPTAGGFLYPETDTTDALQEGQRQTSRQNGYSKDGAPVHTPWRQPEILLEHLTQLETIPATKVWAGEVLHRLQAMATAFANGNDDAAGLIDELAELNHRVPRMAATIEAQATCRKLYKASYALGRRLDIWEAVVDARKPVAETDQAVNADPERLAACLTQIDALMGDAAEGNAWRQYLLVDAMKQRASRSPTLDDQEMRQMAQQTLTRLTQTPLSLQQRQFLTSAPMAVLRNELRQWAAEPIDATTLLDDVERYEQTGLPSDARRLAIDCQHLSASGIASQRLVAQRIDAHYRNANLRVAMSEELLNKLMPERNLEYAPVNDRVLNRPVRGESLMASELTVRLRPDPHRVRLALEITGEIAALTTVNAGPAHFVNESQSYYVATKPLEIDMQAIHTGPAEVDVRNETRVRDVGTGMDNIPLLGALATSVARSQIEMSTPAANQEVRQKIAAQARARVDAEARQQLGEVVERLNRELFDPLNSLALDPQMIDGETTEKRFTMRMRLAGEDQLGSHSPRPQAPSDSLASIQIHESMLNNCLQRLELDGRTFTLAELSKHIADRFNRAKMGDVNPDHEDVTITFAAKDAVTVRCSDGRVEVNVSVAELAKLPRKWKNFQVRVFYKPEVNGRSAELVRDGVVQLPNARLSGDKRILLLGIFNKAFSKNAPWQLMPERIMKDPKLSSDSITQFVISDGWIGISLGPQREASQTVARRKITGAVAR